MMKIEFEKLLRRKALVALTVLALTAVYVWLAFYGIRDTFSGVSLGYFWENAEYRQWKMSQETALVDEAWIESIKAEMSLSEYKISLAQKLLESLQQADRIDTGWLLREIQHIKLLEEDSDESR